MIKQTAQHGNVDSSAAMSQIMKHLKWVNSLKAFPVLAQLKLFGVTFFPPIANFIGWLSLGTGLESL